MNTLLKTNVWLSVIGLAGLLLSGCNRNSPTEGTTQVAGQVVQSQNRQPVGGALVQVYQAGRGGGYAQVGPDYPTDAQGRFTFHFEAESTTGYLLKATAPPGYITDWGAAPELTAGRKNTDLIVSVLAPAWVRLQLVDELPKSRVIIHTQGYEGSGDTFYYPRDTAFTRPLFAGFRTGLLWSIDGQGQSRTGSQYIQPAALDTVTVRIIF